MGCGGSKPTSNEKPHSSKYLANPAQGPDTFGGYDLPSTGPLTAKQYKERLSTSEGTLSVTLPVSGYTIRYAYVSQRGFYPDSPDKANQDSYAVHTCFHGDPEQHFFGVFDGHGEWGTQCSQFARDKVRVWRGLGVVSCCGGPTGKHSAHNECLTTGRQQQSWRSAGTALELAAQQQQPQQKSNS
jgi:hypothetical protein